jgi:hypothetical protein
MNYGNEELVLGDNEMTDIDGTNHEDASCDGDVVMPGVVTLDVGIPSVVLRPRHHGRAFQ